MRPTERQLRIWSVHVRRARPRCAICGTIKGREAHHLYSKRYHPALALEISNGVTLCNHKGNRCHTTFHSIFMGGTRRDCSPADYVRFVNLMKWSAQTNLYIINKKLSDGNKDANNG